MRAARSLASAEVSENDFLWLDSAGRAVSSRARIRNHQPHRAMTTNDVPAQLKAPHQPGAPLYHGTRADLKPGDLIGPGYMSNYGTGRKANHVYFAATLEAAVWGAELAQGEGRGRIYLVEPTGPFVDDPNLTDKKFPGNPTKSYRSKQPVRVVGEVPEWRGHSPEQLKVMH